MHHPERGKHRLGAEPQRSRLPRMPRRTCFTEHLKIVDRRARRAEQRQRFRLCVERVETLRLAGRPMSRPAIPGEHHAQARPLSIGKVAPPDRSEEHTSELQSLMRISYAVFCLKKKKTQSADSN